MKDLELDFVQRLKTADLLSKVTGPLDKIVALAAVFQAVRFTEAEMAQITVKQLGNGVQSFEPPYATFGTLRTQLEDSQAAALLAEFHLCQGLTIADLPWFSAVKKQLEADSVPPKVKAVALT